MKHKSNLTKILRSIHHNNFTAENLQEFRFANPEIKWCDIKYETGDSILHIVARLGKIDILTYILEKWPPKNVDLQNNDCKTPLHEAAQFSQSRVAEIFLKNGAKIDAIKRADWTPLMLACTKSGNESFKTIQVLIQNEANVDLINKDGWNCLHLACRTGDPEIVTFLLPFFKKFDRTKNGRNVLNIACLHGHSTIVKILLDLREFNVNSGDNCGNTPFLDGVCSGNIEVVELLLEKGAKIQTQNNVGLSAVHLAAAEGLLLMLEFLLNDVKISPDLLNHSNQSPLHHAARKRQLDSIKCLIKNGANPEIKDKYGRTYMDYLN